MEVQQLRGALEQNAREMRTARQRLARQTASLDRGGLTQLSVRKVLAVYALSAWDLALAARAAKQLSRSHAEVPNEALVRTFFRDFDLDELLSMFAEEHAKWNPAVKFAQKVLAEHSVWCWVTAQNLVHGVAPSSAQVFSEFERRSRGESVAPPPGRRCVNKWVARWRRRWGVRRGKLRDVDRVDLSTLRQKVGILGPPGGPKNATPGICSTRFWRRFPAPFFGPDIVQVKVFKHNFYLPP